MLLLVLALTHAHSNEKEKKTQSFCFKAVAQNETISIWKSATSAADNVYAMKKKNKRKKRNTNKILFENAMVVASKKHRNKVNMSFIFPLLFV